MSPVEGMDIFEARLASFNTTLPGTKRRASGVKGTKAISWPHKSLSPSQLANAGFYYKPSATSPDNTVCFMCEARLDGWEEDDDPIVEHLTHSNNCPWALVMSGTLEDAEDPTTSKMLDARRETFAGKWPHESKRGWTCKIEKMVEAGWHFAPTPDSDDFVTCAFCKLSLDGWEPKDNPFDEHHRRSPDCRFFRFAGTTAPKATRGKKGRPSKASRVSTQSVISIISEHPSIPDFEDSIDQTTLSQDTVMSTASKAPTKGRKAAKGKGKGSKAKKAEPIVIEDSSVIETSQNDAQIPAAGKGMKRTSEQISTDDEMRRERESTVRPEPATKRRTTRSRTSTAQEVALPSLTSGVPVTTQETDSPQQKPRGGRKRASSRARKVSTASTASKASLRATIPDDSAIEAELAAELENPQSEDEEMIDASKIAEAENKSGGNNAKGTASMASIRKIEVEQSESQMEVEHSQQEVSNDKGKKKGRPAKGKGKKKVDEAAAELPEEKKHMGDDHLESQDAKDDTTHNAVKETPEQVEDAEIIADVKPKKGGKKKATGRAKTKKQSQDVSTLQHEEDGAEQKTASILEETSEAKPKQSSIKKQTGKSKGKLESVQPSMPGAFDSQELSQTECSSLRGGFHDGSLEDSPETSKKASRSGAEKEATPSLSAQSSDAENEPPSSKPSTKRPPLLPVSPSRMQGLQIPLANTPKQSPSKLNKPIGGLKASYPWSSVDVEMIFAPSPGLTDKENVFMNVDGSLTSPEKKLTVEQWISRLAQQTEGRLKDECERIVGIFEKEGSRAMMTLESIDCIE